MTNDARPVADTNPSRSETRARGGVLRAGASVRCPSSFWRWWCWRALRSCCLRPSPPKPDTTWTRMQQEGILRIGVDPILPPLWRTTARAICRALMWRWQRNWRRRGASRRSTCIRAMTVCIDALNGGQFDLILSALPYNPLKTQDVNFSQSYFNGGPVLVVRGEDTTTTGLESLQAQPIAVELGSNGDAVSAQVAKIVTLRRCNSWIRASRHHTSPAESTGRRSDCGPDHAGTIINARQVTRRWRSGAWWANRWQPRIM